MKPVTCCEWVAYVLSWIWFFINHNKWYLAVQATFSLVGVYALACVTKQKTLVIDIIFRLSSITCAAYMIGIYFLFWKKPKITAWIKKKIEGYEFWVMIAVVIVRGLLICGLARFVCFFTDQIHVFEKTCTGYAIATYLVGVFHVVSVCKYLEIKDYVCLSDSLLAVAFLISAKLEPKKDDTQAIRVTFTYISALLLAIYKNSTPVDPDAED